MAGVPGPSGDASTLPNDAKNNSDNLLSIRIAQTPDEVKICQLLRLDVFVKEQKIPIELEEDGKDYPDPSFDGEVVHLLGYCKDEPVATGRLILNMNMGEPDPYSPNGCCPVWIAEIGRIAVGPNHRGKGWGTQIVRKLIAIARSRSSRIYMTPHRYLEDFYSRFGFRRVENEGLKVINQHCQLIKMEMRC